MGFLDKVKAQAESAVKQGQEKLDEQKAKKKADGLLRDLGAWYYATQTERDHGQGAAELTRIVEELKAHEAEHGPLGGAADDDDADDATGGPVDPPVIPTATVPGDPGPSVVPPPPGPGTPPPPPGTPAPPPPPVIPPGPLPPAEVPPMGEVPPPAPAL